MAPLPPPAVIFAWPLFLTVAGIVSWASQYGRDGIIGHWGIHADIIGDGWSKVRLWTGMAAPNMDPGLAGVQPDVQLYAANGKIITYEATQSPHFWSKAGGHTDYYLKPIDRHWKTSVGSGPYEMPEYVRISNFGHDPMCISAVAVQMAPTAREVHLMGDMMRKCRWHWYDSIWGWSFGENLEHEHRPACFWIGGNRNEFPSSVWFHIPDFDGPEAARLYDEMPQRMCGSEPRLHQFYGPKGAFTPLVFDPPMTYADQPDGTIGATGEKATQHDPDIVFNPDKWFWNDNDDDGKSLKKVTMQEELFKQTRPWQWPKLKKREAPSSVYARWVDEYALSNSTDPRFFAEYKCQDDMVVGPDWANSFEGKYCVMETRELLPFCDEAVREYCWDMEREEIRPRAGAQMLLPRGVNEGRFSEATSFGRSKKVKHDFSVR